LGSDEDEAGGLLLAGATGTIVVETFGKPTVSAQRG